MRRPESVSATAYCGYVTDSWTDKRMEKKYEEHCSIVRDFFYMLIHLRLVRSLG